MNKASVGDKFRCLVPVDVHEECNWDTGTVVEVTKIYGEHEGYDLTDKSGEAGSFAPVDLWGDHRWFEPIPSPDCELCGGSGECETELYEGLVDCWRCYPED